MSLLGDLPHDPDTDAIIIPAATTTDTNTATSNTKYKIHNISIPLLVVQALDDPLITWKATVQNTGFMHPMNLVNNTSSRELTGGNSNLLVLLTKSGGHVG